MERLRAYDNLETGSNGIIPILVKGIQENVAANGQPYQSITASDMNGNVKKLSIFKNLFKEIKTPFIIEANVRADLYMGSKTFLIMSYNTKTDLKISDFKPKSEVNPTKVWNEIIKMINTIKDEGLCRFICRVLVNNKKAFQEKPFDSIVFNRINGLMEATYRLMKLADGVAGTIPYLDRDLMLAAASVYYIGQVNSTDEEFNPTMQDVLLGAGVLSLKEIIKADISFQESPEGKDINKDKIILLEHIVMARYKGQYASIPESIALQNLDALLQETEEVHDVTKEIADNGYVDRYYARRNKIFKTPTANSKPEENNNNGKS